MDSPFGVDEALAERLGGGGLVVVVALAILLGLRHATDPDHIVAVSTLAAVGDRSARAATWLGAAWGAGHGVTLLAFGLPVVLFQAFLPDTLQRAAEVLIGVVIVALALRLLLEWRRGALHSHTHGHDDGTHAHLHSHSLGTHRHRVRSAPQAFAIGMAHGLAGSAGVAVLLVASLAHRASAALALVALALGTTVSMTMLTSGLGSLLASACGRRVFARLAPAAAVVTVAFGGWYAVSALVTV